MLEATWPPFLDLLDRDPDRAFRGFYSFAWRLLKVSPPKIMSSLPESDADDLIREILLHCVVDNFRILRRYTDRGKPFAAWLYIVAHNKCLDYLRRKKYSRDYIESEKESAGPIHSGSPEISLDPDRKMQLKGLIEIVRKCMATLSRKCQILLRLSADEYSPREMTAALGLPANMNKKVSDDLRECRKRLKKVLVREGVDLKAALNC